ncbi:MULTISPECIES: aldehyde dehydrogenase family protein [Pseudomonas]|uniref:aldehyde dehydrogenase family protein n=1 Tax=Pseudomonas TaxID=286 RepID=UPI00107EA0C2|nr:MULTISPECIES: aldehyde dehydrogenase family protein [Pseudomonas]TGB15428.1 aldehyde dehydrogenase family protein [Pseudomonas aeruginosa]BBR54611.1 betaine-aldehyde dehydrogenase [Pseudomonas putida]HCF1421232.1 aldehyde dehydrogenase family protein [Pseudomonas aeruginosa]
MSETLYIDGAWQAPTEGRSFDVHDPASEALIQQVSAATREDINKAVRAARQAFDEGPWPRLSGNERAAYLRAMADGMRQRRDALARLEVVDNGKPLPEAQWDIDDAIGCFEYYAGLAEGLDQAGELIELPDDRFRCRVLREPVGVAGQIIPWNYPLLMAAWKVAPALAAGCTTVLKPSELTPLSALELADIADVAQLPAGVLNVVTGLGAEAGAPLSAHSGVDKLAFTGSVPTGRAIMQAAAQDIKNVSLELGGKSAFIVFDDSDVEAAVEWILFGIFWNQGQVCSATSRLLVQAGIHDRLLERLVEEARRIRIGHGLEAGTMLGPLVSRGQHEKVLQAIARGRQEGARLVCGGGRPAHLDRGWFVEPTIFADTPLDSALWCEEIFGPVLAVRRFTDEVEALRLANASQFGLAAAVMSADLERCERVSRSLRAGIVWVNCSQPTFTQAPWGGYKQSGLGRELGVWGLNNYLEIKQVTEYRNQQPWGWYLKP